MKSVVFIKNAFIKSGFIKVLKLIELSIPTRVEFRTIRIRALGGTRVFKMPCLVSTVKIFYTFAVNVRTWLFFNKSGGWKGSW